MTHRWPAGPCSFRVAMKRLYIRIYPPVDLSVGLSVDLSIGPSVSYSVTGNVLFRLGANYVVYTALFWNICAGRGWGGWGRTHAPQSALAMLNNSAPSSVVFVLVSLPLVLLLLYFIYAYDCVEKIVLLLVVGGGSLLFEFRLIVRIDLGYVNDFSRVIPQQVGQTNDEGESKQKK